MAEVPKEAHNNGLNLKTGFENSPFDSPLVSLKLADGVPLTIHRSILLRCVKVRRLSDSSLKTVELRRFSSTAGHALIQYLYASRYGLLKWTGSSDPSRDVELCELKARFEIYALARTVELDGLEEQVRDDIERATEDLDIFTIIDAIKDTYPTSIGNDTWFPRWIKAVSKKAFKDPERLTRITVLRDFRDDASVAKFLFKSMLESYVDVLESLAGYDSVSGTADAVPVEADDTPTSGISFDEIGDDEVRDALEGATEPVSDPPFEPPSEHPPEPHPEPSLEEEPVPEPTPELAEPELSMPKDELPLDEDADSRGMFSQKTKAKKKKGWKKSVLAEAERQAAPEPEQVPEPPAPECEPTPEQVHDALPTETEMLLAGQSEANGHPDFPPEPRTLHQEAGGYTWGTGVQNPEPGVTDPWGTATGRSSGLGKKKKKKRKIQEPDADVIEVVKSGDEPRVCSEPSAEPEDIPEVSRDPWDFWNVPKEKRSPRVSFGC